MPSKYADNETAKVAGRLRAAERKAERKAATEGDGRVQINAGGSHLFILEDIVYFKLRL